MRLNFRCTACGERLDQQRLGQPRHAAQQAVAAGQERGQDLVDHLILADDDAAKLFLEGTDQAAVSDKLISTNSIVCPVPSVPSAALSRSADVDPRPPCISLEHEHMDVALQRD